MNQKNNFRVSFRNKNVIDELDHQININPDHNYNILETILKETVNECMPSKVVKFDKRKHKKTPWITYGILRSINQRNKLYKKFKQAKPETEDYIIRKEAFIRYRSTLRKTMRTAKKTYYYNLFEQYKSNLKKTWSIISETLNKSKSMLVPETMTIGGNECSNKQIYCRIIQQLLRNYIGTK